MDRLVIVGSVIGLLGEIAELHSYLVGFERLPSNAKLSHIPGEALLSFFFGIFSCDFVSGVVIGLTSNSEKIQISLLKRDLPRSLENVMQLVIILPFLQCLVHCIACY